MALKFLLVTALALCHGFNLDTENPMTFQEKARGFGQSVVQLGDSRVAVAAPQEAKDANQTGGLYQCDYSTSRCEPISLKVPPEAVNMSLGLSLAASSDPSQLLACGPTVQQVCEENTYVKGLCFLFGSNLMRPPQQFPEALRECPKQESDIAFLIDGSGSIHPRDFQKMKEFVSTVMEQFTKSKTLFSLMQYSDEFRTHFNFDDFKKNPNPRTHVNPIRQLNGKTKTASGIRKVVRELFQKVSGARENALKILVVITDGEKYGDPLNYEDVIPEANRAGVIRYVIGVGNAFSSKKSRQELDTIASKPAEDHVFQVDNFEALKTIQNQLQEKIFAIEGTQTGSTSSFEHEMSQEGFSAAITSNGPLLGSVGSFDWTGGAFLYTSNNKATFINTTRVDSDMNDAYLGYSSAVIMRSRVQSLVLGAPRYQHTGLVVMFRQNFGAWEPQANIKGSQIGSYFGASLCSVDMDGDGNTDLILIGAPHYYEQTRGGQVSVCPLPKGRARWQCEVILHGVQGHPWGRFGAALTVLGDVNGDKLTDVAIGAPGEQENQGAVYIFHGASTVSISTPHSQRIAGASFSLKLQYFGQSLSGGKDLTMDGLTDLAVGAQGHLLLLRAQPVLRLEATMEFIPNILARSVFACQNQESRNKDAGEVRVCLRVRKNTRDRLQEGDIRSTVTYDLALDPGRTQARVRAIFEETKNNTRQRVQVLGLMQKCETLKLLLPVCVEDSVSPIILRLNYTLVGEPLGSSRDLRPVLAVDAQRLFTAMFPFEKNCGNDSICQDDLSITLSSVGRDTLVVGDPRDFNLRVTVRNDGEDSYGTKATFYYPAGLSYRKVSASQNQRQQRSLHLTCDSTPSRSQGLWRTSCSIRHIIFRGGAQVSLASTYPIPCSHPPDSSTPYSFSVPSENDTPETNKTTFQLELPVKYAVYTVISSHDQSTKYLNFSASDKEKSSVVEHRYQVNNLGQRDVPASINFWVPIALKGEAVWTVKAPHLQNLPTQCYQNRLVPAQSDFLAHMQKSPVLDCSIADCLHFRCDIPSLGIQDELDFILKGNLSFGWVSQTLQKKVVVLSVAEITFDTSVYSQLPGQEAFLRAQTKTVLEMYEVHNPVPLIVGSSVGGLLLLALITGALYKVGFFKRQYKEMMAEANGQTVSGNETSDPQDAQ
ncbi:Integrin alpha-M [Lemmus lemmus]